MEDYSEAYKNRCVKRLSQWGAPVSDWSCVEMHDALEDGGGILYSCELCDCTNVRFVHTMRHPRYFEDVYVGCVCAGIMQGDILAARARERLVQNRSKRKKNFLKRQWKVSFRDCYTLRYKRQWLRIFGNSGGYRVFCDGRSAFRYKGKTIPNFLTAVHAAFDLVDPPIGGGPT